MLRKNDPEWAKENSEIHRKCIYKSAHKWMKNNPDKVLEIGRNNIKKAHEANKKIFEKGGIQAENLKNIRKENIKIADKALRKLLNENEDFKNKMFEIHSKNGKIHGPINLKKSKEKRIAELKKLFEENPIQFNSKFISFEKLQELRQNDICGTWVINAKFKAYKGTNRENEIFKIGPFKSKKVYDEMYWAFRVLSQPEKQDKFDLDWTIAKWWYFANLYYDFEFELLTDKNGVSEEEALVTEAAYASKYDLFIEFTEDKKGKRIPVVEKHGYWSP